MKHIVQLCRPVPVLTTPCVMVYEHPETYGWHVARVTIDGGATQVCHDLSSRIVAITLADRMARKLDLPLIVERGGA